MPPPDQDNRRQWTEYEAERVVHYYVGQYIEAAQAVGVRVPASLHVMLADPLAQMPGGEPPSVNQVELGHRIGQLINREDIRSLKPFPLSTQMSDPAFNVERGYWPDVPVVNGSFFRYDPPWRGGVGLYEGSGLALPLLPASVLASDGPQPYGQPFPPMYQPPLSSSYAQSPPVASTLAPGQPAQPEYEYHPRAPAPATRPREYIALPDPEVDKILYWANGRTPTAEHFKASLPCDRGMFERLKMGHMIPREAAEDIIAHSRNYSDFPRTVRDSMENLLAGKDELPPLRNVESARLANWIEYDARQRNLPAGQQLASAGELEFRLRNLNITRHDIYDIQWSLRERGVIAVGRSNVFLVDYGLRRQVYSKEFEASIEKYGPYIDPRQSGQRSYELRPYELRAVKRDEPGQARHSQAALTSSTALTTTQARTAATSNLPLPAPHQPTGPTPGANLPSARGR